MSATETGTQVYEVEIRATPQQVWTALTTSEWTERFGYGGRVEYDLRPGGAYRAFAPAEMVAMGAPEVMVDGEVIEADAPRRLVQTWHATWGEETSAEPPRRLTYELEPAGAGTRLTLVHELEGAPATAKIVGGGVPEMGGGGRFVLDDLKRVLEEDGTRAA